MCTFYLFQWVQSRFYLAYPIICSPTIRFNATPCGRLGIKVPYDHHRTMASLRCFNRGVQFIKVNIELLIPTLIPTSPFFISRVLSSGYFPSNNVIYREASPLSSLYQYASCWYDSEMNTTSTLGILVHQILCQLAAI